MTKIEALKTGLERLKELGECVTSEFREEFSCRKLPDNYNGVEVYEGVNEAKSNFDEAMSWFDDCIAELERLEKES